MHPEMELTSSLQCERSGAEQLIEQLAERRIVFELGQHAELHRELHECTPVRGRYRDATELANAEEMVCRWWCDSEEWMLVSLQISANLLRLVALRSKI